MQHLEPIYLDRLAALYVLAASIPSDDRFGINAWAKANERSECGTTACLAGHAALHPHFVAQGFKRGALEYVGSSRQGCMVAYELSPEERASDAYNELCNNSEGNWDPYTYELAMFWGLGSDEIRCRDQEALFDLDEPIMLHPFWPTSYLADNDFGDSERYMPTAAQAAAYVLKYMHYWWPQRDVNMAIERHSHVTYNASFVHFYMPWTPANVTVDELAAWKLAIDSGQTTLGAAEWIEARQEVMQYAGQHVLPGHLVL